LATFDFYTVRWPDFVCIGELQVGSCDNDDDDDDDIVRLFVT